MLWVFACGDIAVMAADTVAGDVTVVKSGRQPSGGSVTTIAFLCRREVVGIFTDGDIAVVTA